MNLPIQAQPVMRNVSTAAFTAAMEASSIISSIGCPIACAGCDRLSGIAKTICLAAARAAGCDC